MATSQLLSSTGTWDGIYADLLEHVPALHWPTSVRTYSEMRTDPKLTSVLAAYTLPLRRAAWAVDPAGCRPEVVQLVADGLGLPVLGVDVSTGGARRRGVRWKQHVRMALLSLVFGHMPFEIEVDATGPRTTLVGLHERLPITITDIRTNSDGSLKGITQDSGVVVNRDIDASRLAWYVHEREGSAWQGRSLLRAAYAPWLIKHEMQRVHATSNRRFGMGVPGFEPQPGVTLTPTQLAEAQRLASSVRVGEKGGYAAPTGMQFVLKGLTGSVPDTLAFLRWLDQQMSGMALTGVLDLGDTANGSRALGDTFLELLLLSQQSVAEEVADVTTADVAVRLVDWNWGEDEPVPNVVVGDVGASHQVTAESLNALLTSGALSSDPELEAYVRRTWKLPERDPDAPPAVPPSKLPVAARAGSGRRKIAAAAGPLRRTPTAVEAAAKVDFAKLQGDWQTALDQLITDWDAITTAQRAGLVDAIRTAAAADDVTALSSLTVDSQPAAELLVEALHEAADQAAADAAAEAQAQGVTVPLDGVEVDRDRLDTVATVVAALLATGLAAAAGRKALQVWGPDTSADDVATAVDDHLGLLTDASLRDGLGGGLSVAQNAGRVAVLHAAPAADRYVASEILDANTCQPCQDIDGTEFVNLAAAVDSYASGGFISCDGGLRCRGIIATVWDAATIDQAA